MTREQACCMMKRIGQNALAAGSCVVCMVVCWRSFLTFEGTEFGSGSLAGNQVLASLTFATSSMLFFIYPRVAAISALVACYWSLPLYLYLVFPRPFRQVWPGPWKVPLLPKEVFVCDGWWITGIIFTTFLAYVCCRSLVRSLFVRSPIDLIARRDPSASREQ